MMICCPTSCWSEYARLTTSQVQDDSLLNPAPDPLSASGLEFSPPISTHKMNQTYRSPRYETSYILALLKQRVILEADINAALEELSR